MNAAHIHLILNHVPLVGVAIGVVLLAWALWHRSDELRTAALAIVLVTGATAVPVFLSGEEAEELVEELPGVDEARIEAHEEAAEAALLLFLVAAAAALAALIAPRLRSAWTRPAAVMAIVAAIVALGAGAWTGNLGGKIRHTEILAADAGGLAGAFLGEAEEDGDEAEEEEGEERGEREARTRPAAPGLIAPRTDEDDARGERREREEEADEDEEREARERE